MTRWRFHAGVLVAAAIASTPPAEAADCLAYLAADRSFHEKRAANGPIFRAVGDALEAQDEAGLHALEVRDEGRWKAFIESWRKLNQASWKTAYAEAKAVADAAWNDYEAASAEARTAIVEAEDVYDAALAARNAAWNDWETAYAEAEAAYAETTVAHDAALAARDAAHKEAWGYDAAAARLVAAYVETYAASGHDVAGYDVGLIFKAAAHERQTACPILGIPGWLEPLEHLAKE